MPAAYPWASATRTTRRRWRRPVVLVPLGVLAAGVLTLALLYTYRVFAGAVVIAVPGRGGGGLCSAIGGHSPTAGEEGHQRQGAGLVERYAGGALAGRGTRTGDSPRLSALEQLWPGDGGHGDARHGGRQRKGQIHRGIDETAAGETVADENPGEQQSENRVDDGGDLLALLEWQQVHNRRAARVAFAVKFLDNSRAYFAAQSQYLKALAEAHRAAADMDRVIGASEPTTTPPANKE